MKLSRLPLLVILIAGALFLTGATEPAKAPIAAPTQKTVSDDPAPAGNAPADESNSPFVTPAAKQTAETYAYRIDNYYYNADIGWNRREIVAVLSTLGLVIVAAWLMYFVKRTAGATEAAAEAARKSAVAAAENVIAMRALANLERPWIVVGKKNLIGFPLEENPMVFPLRIEISWELKNVGRSPGLITDISREIICAPMAYIPEPSYADDPMPGGELLIPPAGDFPSRFYKEISEEAYGNFMTRDLCILFYGRIQYYDTSRRQHHVTRFFYRWYRENDQLMLDSETPRRDCIEYT